MAMTDHTLPSFLPFSAVHVGGSYRKHLGTSRTCRGGTGERTREAMGVDGVCYWCNSCAKGKGIVVPCGGSRKWSSER